VVELTESNWTDNKLYLDSETVEQRYIEQNGKKQEPEASDSSISQLMETPLRENVEEVDDRENQVAENGLAEVCDADNQSIIVQEDGEDNGSSKSPEEDGEDNGSSKSPEEDDSTSEIDEQNETVGENCYQEEFYVNDDKEHLV